MSISAERIFHRNLGEIQFGYTEPEKGEMESGPVTNS
jgi:hypothetical protein